MVAVLLLVLVGLVAVMIMCGSCNAEEHLCNTIVDAAVTMCVKQVAGDLNGENNDDRVSRSKERKTAECTVNSTTSVSGGAMCESNSLPRCRQCLTGATDRVINLCPDRIGGQINFTLCSFRFELHPWS
ncbi:unnamed protein product [Linum trigynum]|uniref:Gnk2-homologous domain-containing protein n=1 Tax=Linum trigynum TaxID=586398 RepID=A0AAV2DL24_9ROSI